LVCVAVFGIYAVVKYTEANPPWHNLLGLSKASCVREVAFGVPQSIFLAFPLEFRILAIRNLSWEFKGSCIGSGASQAYLVGQFS